MTQFPDKLDLPDDVLLRRAQRKNELVLSASWGVYIRIAIIIFELVGVSLFSSWSLLMDALASSIDVISTLLLILFIKLAARPPDTDHPFGHGRYEPLVGLQLGLLLIVIGGGMFIQQCLHFFEEAQDKVIDSYAWVFPVVAVISLEACYRTVMYTAKKQNSPALAADAFHYRIDAITSLFAAIALIAAAFIPERSHLIDHAGAILIAVLMVILGIVAARSNLDQLVDKIPDATCFERVKRAAMLAEGVLGTEKIGIQQFGPDAHVDIDVEVDPFLTVEVAHEISQRVRLEIQKEWPAVRDVIVHVEPYYPNDH